MSDRTTSISWNDFEKVEIRTGTIVRAEDFPEARIPAYKLWVDIGEAAPKMSSARITTLYSKEELVGKQVICVTNFPPKRIGSVMSEVLVTGFYQNDKDVVLAVPDKPVPNGVKLA
jgi:tRNA-binding protein